MKNILFPRHTATLLQYIGIGLISGSISHGFFSGMRSLVTAVVGVTLFTLGLYYENLVLHKKSDIGTFLFVGILFSISTAMVAGGIQHFQDSPWRSVWIIPLGYFISLLMYRSKEAIQSTFFKTLTIGGFIAIITFVILYPLAMNTPQTLFIDHHGNTNKKELHGHSFSTQEEFIVNMIAHHQEAVDTARLVVAKGESAELKKLAQAIITAQEKEIAMMQKWSKDWNYSTVTPTYQNMMGDGTKLSGKALDTWFLQGMIMHHMGAVQMAQSVLRLDVRKEVSDFAQEVIRIQSSEISQMKLMLGDAMMMHRDIH